jgi:phosphoglycerol transferase MdoB-like AlkP superfamily enzyme
MISDFSTIGSARQRFAPLIALSGWYIGVCAVLRLALWIEFGADAQVRASALLWIIPAGAISDAIASLYLLALFALFLWLMPDRWYRRAWIRGLLLTGSALFMFAFLFIAAVEFFFFDEFDSRFNLVSVDYLMYPTEVAGDIWAEYPVIPLLIATALLALGCVWWLRSRLTAGSTAAPRFRHRSVVFGTYAALLALTLALFSTNTLGLSGNRVANELAANGPSSFFRALRTSEIDYHAYYATRDPAQNLHLLQQQIGRGDCPFTRLAEGRLDRSCPARREGLGRLNVVLITSESFGAEFSKLYGSQRDWTPEFDRYARQSLWFSKVYASGTRTVRGLEAVTASIPPIPTDSVVRRPGHDHIATLGAVLAAHGYHSAFLYGGYGYFDNMNEFYGSNGYELRDRNQLTRKPRFENIWGVADEDLFDLAVDYMDQRARTGQPFFVHIMNTSNHKPFTFRGGLESLGIRPQGGGRESGVRYADYAQGYFLREAAKHPWFDNTVFILVADHGARVYGRQEIPLKTYEIPLLIYSPKHIAPRRVDSLLTQIDIAPTLMGLLGLPYTAPWFGEDVLRVPEQGRVAFFSHNHDVALLKNDELAILGLQKTEMNKRYDRQKDAYSKLAPDRALNDLAVAYYQTAYELFKARKYDLAPAPVAR